MNKTKKTAIKGLIIGLIIIVIYFAYSHFASPTRIALINFQPFVTTSIQLANTDKFVTYTNVPLDKLNKLDKYDCVIGNGMGLKITEEQRQIIKEVADKGTPMYFHSVTNPANNICNLDSITKADISNYLGYGNKKNYQSLARYIRLNIDKKKFFTNQPDSLLKNEADILYHLDEERYFKTVAEYEAYLKENNFFKENAPKLAMVGGFNDPFSGNRDNIDSIIVSFENAGFNIYPISSLSKRLDFLKEINPDAVIYFPHGRLAMGQGDVAIEWLKSKNIPMFAPLSLLITEEQWQKDKMGMYGGFLSQSIMTPELDGAIYPYVLNAQQIDNKGFYRFKALPDRLKTFTQIVSNFVNLKTTPNADKKVAIFYYKGPGQSALAAQGIETSKSLYNLLKHLKSEGYTVKNLPENAKDFQDILMEQGAVFSTYATGIFNEFIQNGNPLLVEKNDYESWVKQAMPAQSYKDVVERYGEAPGQFMAVNKDDKSFIAVSAVQFGNVVVLPQPLPAIGDDGFAIVHGAKAPPTHTYIAPYLWMQYGFKADALIHFGTHGSLEFTPQKQVALSNYDWSDILVGSVPHFYYYTIGNIGESVMAKRRAYSTLISYLTPAFTESRARNQYTKLHEAIHDYFDTDSIFKEQVSLHIKKIAVEMGLHRYLRLDSVLTKPYTEEDILRLDNFAEEISTEKITGTLYVSGETYTPEKVNSTVLAMSADPIAYSMALLDKSKGKVTAKQLENKAFFTKHYLNPAKQIVNDILNNKVTPDSKYIANIAGVTTEEIENAQEILAPPMDMMSMMMMGAKSKGNSKMPSMEEMKAQGKSMPEGMMKKMKSSDSVPPTMMQMMKKMGHDKKKPDHMHQETHKH